MTMGSSTRCPNKLSATLLVLLLCSAIGILSVQAADPDPLVDVSPAANNTFVIRDVFKNGDVSHGSGGTRAALNISIFPALTFEGITYVQFKLRPCGENLPHTHPRATEILTMISGGPIQVGVVDTKGQAHIYILSAGDIVVFPRGLLHFELNVGTEEAFFISALNSQNPGVLTSQQAFFSLPTRAAAGAINQDFGTAKKLKKDILGLGPELHLVGKESGCVPGQDITTAF